MFHMPRLKAERLLERARAGEIRLTHKGWYDAIMLTTGDKEQAEAAARQEANRQLDAERNGHG